MSAHAKICGLTTPDALDAALAGGAAFVGAVVFPRSPRHIAPLHAATLFERARNKAKIVAVTVDADDALLTEIALILKPDLIQLHGSETPARAERVRTLTEAGTIKVLPIRAHEDFAEAETWEPFVDHLMFDAKPPEGSALPGGVGARFDWTLLAGRAFRHPWFVAGGLTPDNVAQAIRVSGAPLVDVSSGVESAPGVKDPALIAAFLEATRSA
ncbi:MAG: phosphoribosylanthranilate isomerase [Brevundimonas sp.]|uniref:phosphoribosylanthranilate isomerase n=1 Tax=Brevundimonas sp. TaxID=1871086 RepID=UPI00262D902E|nr:phosphoribosylanthranilate isomerase [Brevundimonas sp.]MDI6624572.1 phosphoribosylanthranilate isomerase [Brevundimonas sp.]MDQ7813867.1 phosphoribosylanthranilate isomerase [Brevundimonas sp.]